MYGITIHEFHVTNPPLRTIPDTVVMGDYSGQSGKGSPRRIYEIIKNHVADINTNPKSIEWIWRRGAMFVNLSIPPLRAEAIMCGGNFVHILGYENGKYKCEAYPYNRTTPIPATQNWRTRPDLNFKACAVNAQLDVSNPGNGLDAYIPVLGMQNYVYISERLIEVFPVIPLLGLPVILANGSAIRIFKYRVRGASVLGFTGLKWIYLRKATRPGECVEATSWHLQTSSVVVPLSPPP